MKYPAFVVKEIRHLASTLPKQNAGGKVVTYNSVKGRDILKIDTITEEEKKTIDAEARYVLKSPGIQVNHERRMKKQYTRGGRVGYLLYYDYFIKPGPLKLQLWEQISAEVGRELDDQFRNELLGKVPPLTDEQIAELPQD